jgi:hypothetical protein
MKGRASDLPPTTKETERWLTPRWVLDALGTFDLDPCGAPGWPTATTVWTPEDGHDGLTEPWFGRVWMNPPYGREAVRWLRKLVEHGRGTALIFARTDTAAFHETVWERARGILFLRGRLTFLRPDGTRPIANAGAASCLVAYGASDAQILATSGLPGRYVHLSDDETSVA